MVPASSAPARGMLKLQRAAVGGWALLDRRWVVMLITAVFALTFRVAQCRATAGPRRRSSQLRGRRGSVRPGCHRAG